MTTEIIVKLKPSDIKEIIDFYKYFLELKLKISKLELIILKDVRELFIFDNNTFYPIDFYGNCDFNPFKKVDELLHSINHNQFVLRQIAFMKRKG